MIMGYFQREKSNSRTGVTSGLLRGNEGKGSKDKTGCQRKDSV